MGLYFFPSLRMSLHNHPPPHFRTDKITEITDEITNTITDAITETKASDKTENSMTPKAFDLKNHYGHSTVSSPFGADLHGLYKQYVQDRPDTFMPFKTDGRKNILEAAEY